MQRRDDAFRDVEELVRDGIGKVHAHHGDVPVETRLLKLTEAYPVPVLVSAFTGRTGHRDLQAGRLARR